MTSPIEMLRDAVINKDWSKVAQVYKTLSGTDIDPKYLEDVSVAVDNFLVYQKFLNEIQEHFTTKYNIVTSNNTKQNKNTKKDLETGFSKKTAKKSGRPKKAETTNEIKSVDDGMQFITGDDDEDVREVSRLITEKTRAKKRTMPDRVTDTKFTCDGCKKDKSETFLGKSSIEEGKSIKICDNCLIKPRR